MTKHKSRANYSTRASCKLLLHPAVCHCSGIAPFGTVDLWNSELIVWGGSELVNRLLLA